MMGGKTDLRSIARQLLQHKTTGVAKMPQSDPRDIGKPIGVRGHMLHAMHGYVQGKIKAMGGP